MFPPGSQLAGQPDTNFLPPAAAEAHPNKQQTRDLPLLSVEKPGPGFAIISWRFKEGGMATTTANVTKTAPVNLTPKAISKVKEIMGQQNPVPAGLRVGVQGGGCSGFSYAMSFENAAGMMDKTFDFDGLKVFVDATSLMYLNGCNIDYIESLEGAAFKFDNPYVKSTCGCGSSFQA